MNTMNSLLEGFMPICISALFTTAVAYNAMIFVFLAQFNNLFVCYFMITASSIVTFIGFSIFKYAELMESLSQQVAKDVQMRAYRDWRLRITLKNLNQARDGDAYGWIGVMPCPSSNSRFERNFQRMPMRLQVVPFGAIKKGHAGSWIQRIIENTAEVILMVTVMDNRMLF